MNSVYDLKSDNLTGSVVLLAFLMVIGFVGNMHVIFVYMFRLKPSNHRIYIIFLGVLDTVACTLLIPINIYVDTNLWSHGNDFTCKFGQVFSTFILTASACTLLLVAIDRYRKICCPLGWQIYRKIAKLLCGFVLILAFLFSLPDSILREPTTVYVGNVTIVTCSTADENIKYIMYHRVVMALIFFASLCILIVLYVLILLAASKLHTGTKVICDKQCQRKKDDHFTIERDKVKYLKRNGKDTNEIDAYKNYITANPQVDDAMEADNIESEELNQEKKVEHNLTCYVRNRKCKIGPKLNNMSKRMTLVFTLITVIYFLSYAPSIIISIFTLQRITTQSASPGVSDYIAMEILSSCIFVNSVANCFIYGCFDRRFRHEIAAIYNLIFSICKC